MLTAALVATSAAFAPQYAPVCSVAPRADVVLRLLQVVTDIDDTIKSSGGVAIADIALGGVDTSYSRGAFYPGVFCFAAEMASHAAGRSEQPADVAVLTARAREFRAFLEIKQSDKLCVGFRRAGEECGHEDWGVGPVLYGSVAEWICQERKGWRKFENFKLLRQQTDERPRYVFVGDNGKSEKDLEAAERIVEAFPQVPGAARSTTATLASTLRAPSTFHLPRPTQRNAPTSSYSSHSFQYSPPTPPPPHLGPHLSAPRAPQDLDAVFVHAVSADTQPAPLPADHTLGGVPVRYFRTYASAAAKAAALGLLSAAGARRVLQGVEADMASDPAGNIAPGSANEALLLDELAEARAAVGTGAAVTIARLVRPLRRPLRRLRLGADAAGQPSAAAIAWGSTGE